MPDDAPVIHTVLLLYVIFSINEMRNFWQNKSKTNQLSIKNRNYRFYVAKYALTPAFRLGIKITAEFGFSREFIIKFYFIFYKTMIIIYLKLFLIKKYL